MDSVGPRRPLCAWVRKAARASRPARKPSCASWAVRSGGSVGIVGLQVVGHDISIVGVRRQVKVDGDGAAALHAQAVTGDGQRARVAQAASDDLGDGGREDLVAVQIQDTAAAFRSSFEIVEDSATECERRRADLEADLKYRRLPYEICRGRPGAEPIASAMADLIAENERHLVAIEQLCRRFDRSEERR